MEVLHQAYPHLHEVFLEWALYDAGNDVLVALELLRINAGQPNSGSVMFNWKANRSLTQSVGASFR
jgi:hypothetical protein